MPRLHFTANAFSTTPGRLLNMQKLSAAWKPGQALDVAAEMMRLALQITALTLFDTEVTPEIQVINEEVNVVMDLYNFLVALPRAELASNSPLPGMRRFRKAKGRLDEVVDGMIEARRAESAGPGKLEQRGDLLSMLLAARDEGVEGDRRGLTANELRDQVLTLFLAGYETVASGRITWTWLLLGQNPEAEERLHAELEAVLAGRSPGLDDVPRLEYTTVLTESMRLFPPAWAMGREVLEDVSIGPYRFRQGRRGF